LRVVYGVGGETDLEESTLDHLTGYESAKPVRIGNAAHGQAQHDVWGALLDSVFLHLRSGEFLSGATWKGLERQVEGAIAHWREPKQGRREMRGTPGPPYFASGPPPIPGSARPSCRSPTS